MYKVRQRNKVMSIDIDQYSLQKKRLSACQEVLRKVLVLQECQCGYYEYWHRKVHEIAAAIAKYAAFGHDTPDLQVLLSQAQENMDLARTLYLDCVLRQKKSLRKEVYCLCWRSDFAVPRPMLMID